MPFKLPSTLPGPYVQQSGQSSTSDVDTGGYDFMVGGHGFRFATDTQYPYQRVTEPTTVHRFDSSLEPGEQTLSELPWIKSQASFHAGAGQLNLEQGFTAFQYQQEQVEHIRFDTCHGVDVWTPGQVSRLPDTTGYSIGAAVISMVTSSPMGNNDYAIVSATGILAQVKWASGPDSAPTVTNLDMSNTAYGGAGNWVVNNLTTDGFNYYATVALTTAVSGSTGYVIKGTVNATTAPVILYNLTTNSPVTLGWAKQRLMAAVGNSVYELSPSASAAPLPTAKYTNPTNVSKWGGVAESPGGILLALHDGSRSSILELTLDTSGGTPTLTGGSTIATLPPGERIISMFTYLGSTLGVATTSGLRVASFDTYTGAVKMGPLSWNASAATAPAGVAGRDRFLYGTTNQGLADGSSGLFRIDISMVVDAGGRNAYAPDLRMPSSDAHRTSNVVAVGVLPLANRVVFATAAGYLYVEGNGPGTDGASWLRTSRIRYDTAEPKLFTQGRIHGTLDVASIQVTATVPFGQDQNLGTFGFITGSDSAVNFGLPADLHEWLQLKFTLNGSACVMTTYQVKALPAPARQHLIVVTANCFRNEVDRFGLDVTDPELPRQRYQNVRDLETAGGEIRYVEFTNTGSTAELVVIDQLDFHSFSRPTVEDDFGGYITFKLRVVDS